MEAVPKLPLLSFELKVSPETTHFGPKLKQYIADAYREDPESYSNEMHQLESLRSSAVRPSIDAAGLSALYRYFCQLRAMQSRFPMAKGQPAACTFAWKDLYANMSSPLADVRFEMASILHNIGALHTQLGASEPRTSPESLKAACTHFQNAAWAFQLVKEQYPQPTGIDVSSEMMTLLQEICFAQAQECILEKSIQDTRKPSVIGAVATQVMFFYRNCLNHLGASTGSDNVHEIIGGKLYNFWHRFLSFKLAYIGCIVCLYQGMHAEEQQKMGERVAFYQQAVEKLAEAQKLAKYVEPVQVTKEALTFTNDVVEGKRKAAKNENEFIYHEEVPDKDLLMDMKPVCLVKALPVNLNDPEISGTDIFSRLIPMGAHEASSVYSEEKAKLLRQVVSQVEAKNTELTEFMSSLQLDQLEVLDSDQKIPQEIVDRCAAMNAKTEVIQTLVDSMNNLAEIISDVENSLAEIKTLIQEETLKEKEFQKVMGPRPPSIVQTELSREFHKYQEAHARTNESNQVLHKAMTLHIANLRQLAVPLDVLQSRIPTIDNIEGLDRAAMSEMRRVVAKAHEMQTQRDSLVAALRAAVAADDVTAALLARPEPRDQLFAQQLAKHDAQVKIIETNLAAQENIINRLTSLYASYGESRRMLSDLLRKRDSIINALITSYDTYGELLGKCQKGLEFYKKLSHNVSQLLTRLRGTCQVQEEERESLLAKNTKGGKAATPVPSSPARMERSDTTEPRSEGSGLKLKDYLPYMKKRQLPKTPQGSVQPEILPPEAYYPESIYPTSVRPAPVGSEATDPTQMQLPDGVVMPQVPNVPHQYARFNSPYSQEPESYSTPSNFYPSKGFDKPDDYPSHSAYIPPQYSHQMTNPQTYANPYYSGSRDSGTIVTDSQSNSYAMHSQASANTATSQSGPSNMPSNSQATPQYIYDVYGQNHVAPIPENPSISSGQDLSTNFSQMHVSAPKDPNRTNFGNDYSQTYYSVNYPQAAPPNMATYSNAEQNTHTVPSQSTDYNTQNYPYNESTYAPNSSVTTYAPNSAASTYAPNSAGSTYAPNSAGSTYAPNSAGSTYAPNSVGPTHSSNPAATYAPTPTANYSNPAMSPYAPISSNNVSTYGTEQYNYTTGYETSTQGYPVYTNADTISYSTSTVTVPASLDSTYNPPEPNPVLSQIDAFDKPIKSHVTGEALNYPGYQSYEPSYTPTPNPEAPPPSAYYQDPANVNYAHTYQNHPGYNFNPGTGAYDYNYGSQNSYASYVQPIIDPQSNPKDPNWNAQGVYTSAGGCQTVQSPSETPQTLQPSDNQIYYNTPYGYITNTNQSQVVVSNPEVTTTNYGANVNQSTYMQSGEQYNTNVTFSKNQVSSPKEEIQQPSFEAKPEPVQSAQVPVQSPQVPVQSPHVPVQNTQVQETVQEPVKEEIPDPIPEPSVFDLLSDIDFTVEQKPLMPDIKVPQISESAIKKPLPVPKVEPAVKPVQKEEVIQRPPKRDLFSDPTLLNNFTQDVKNLQTLVDSLTNIVPGGLTLLDSKWKQFQDLQAKESSTRSKSIAKRHGGGNIVPYDDSRLTLRSDPSAYINASYYKQLASWCIPLVISAAPEEKQYSVLWKAVVENKITCVVCLQTEIEMQGKFYWPTAKGQSLGLPGVTVVLDDVTCTVHWTERKLTVTHGDAVLKVSHYQINVFPAKIVCSPIILLVDKILSETFESRPATNLSGAWLQCGLGGGRSALVALTTALVCQARAGQRLCETLDEACMNLYKHRTDVLEDTKYLADAYRTALFYVQGVLCSGTTSFNGEAISLPSGAAILPPATPAPAPAATTARGKFSRESFEEMKQSPGLKSGDMKDPLNFLDPLWSLKKK